MAIREAQPGTVSHGTMRNVDLIPAFLDVLRACNAPEYEQILMQPFPIPPSAALEDPRDDWWDSERADQFMEELFDVLNHYAPEGHYFGAHPGDGSDFGFWPSEEYEGNGAPPERYRALHERVWKAARQEGYEPVETEWVIPMGQGVYNVAVTAPTQTGRKVVSVQVPSEGYEGNASTKETQFKHLLFGTRFRFVNAADAPPSLGTFGDIPDYRKTGHRRCAVAIGEGTGRNTFSCSPSAWVIPFYASYEDNGRRYWTVVIPYSEYPTKWHPTDRSGPFSVLTRGAFGTETEAHAWAKKHLEGQPYRVDEQPEDVAFQAGVRRKVQAPFHSNAAPPPRQPHHFAVNVRGGGRKDPSWSPGEELWRRRELILPTESDPDAEFPLEGGVVGALYQWHGGQGSMVYSLASAGDGDLVSRSMIRAAMDELDRDRPRISGEDKQHLEALLGELELILSYPEGASASEAGMDIDEYEYDTWSEWTGGEMEGNQSDPKVYLSMSEGKYRVIQQGVPISPDKHSAETALAAASKWKLQVSDRMWNGDTGEWQPLRELPGLYPFATNASRKERARAALAGEPEPGVDEHAAQELELYLDNDARFSMDSSSGIGHSIRQNLLKKIKKGTYDHSLAPQGWMHAVDAAAQAYAKEFDDAKRWHVMFNAPTRRAVAKSMADSFHRRVLAGEYS